MSKTVKMNYNIADSLDEVNDQINNASNSPD